MDAADVGLPKWPQMRVWGPSITPEQAREIIIRTDQFWQGYGGNDHDFQRRLCAAVGFPYMDYGDRNMDWRAASDGQERFRASIGYVGTEYVHNGWISNAFIFGPSGWCHPDGTIHFVHNVGKWPSVREVMEDWAVIAQEWPFLDLDACLMSGEGCEDDARPLVTIQVRAGGVTAHAPESYDFLSRFGRDGEAFDQPDIGVAVRRIMMSACDREQRWTVEEVTAMVSAVRASRAEMIG